MTACFVYITASNAEEARRIGRSLVEARLAACANVHERITAIYWWEGAVQEGAEAVLVAKTREELLPDLTAKVRALHSYTVPCVVAWPLAGGNPAFLAWIEAEHAEAARG